ncbi:MAG: hypothetical protein ACO3AA_05995 [Chitinophagaceae bacterium]
MNRILFISLFTLIFSLRGISQHAALDFSLVKELTGKFEKFNVDELDCIYALSTSGQLKKYSSNFDSIAVFNDIRRYGNLNTIHIQNPLRALLFFKDFNAIVAVDRLMQVIQKVDLRRINLFQLSTIAPSYDNMIWIYDEQVSKIKKIGLDGKIAFESVDLRMVFNEKISPFKMFEHQGALYLVDHENGIYIFDYYGGFKFKIHYPGIIDCQSLGNLLIGRNKDQIWMMKEGDLSPISISIPKQILEASQFYLASKMAYTLKDGAIAIYTYNLKH